MSNSDTIPSGNNTVMTCFRTLQTVVRIICTRLGETVFVTPKMGRDLCDESRKELDMIFSFEHMEIDQYFVKWFPRKFRPKKFFEAIDKWQNALEWCASYLENHDQPRSVSRFGNANEYHNLSAKMLATMLMTLKGTVFLYQGQEIGMTNFDYKSLDEIEDVETHNIMKLAKKLHIPKWYRWNMIKRGCRDHARTPMQWNNDKNGGFTDGIPWLGVNKNYVNINAEDEELDTNSILNYYKVLINYRAQSDILRLGDFKALKMDKNLFVYKRTYKGKSLIIVLNFKNRNIKFEHTGKVIKSNYTETNDGSIIRPYEALIITGGITL